MAKSSADGIPRQNNTTNTNGRPNFRGTKKNEERKYMCFCKQKSLKSRIFGPIKRILDGCILAPLNKRIHLVVAVKAAGFRKRKSISKIHTSLQNRRISGASAIHESAGEARERARSAKPELSACSHTIVYALSPGERFLLIGYFTSRGPGRAVISSRQPAIIAGYSGENRRLLH